MALFFDELSVVCPQGNFQLSELIVHFYVYTLWKFAITIAKFVSQVGCKFGFDLIVFAIVCLNVFNLSKRTLILNGFFEIGLGTANHKQHKRDDKYSIHGK